MNQTISLFTLTMMLAVTPAAAQHVHPAGAPHPAADAGISTAALGAEQIRQLLEGEGMGLAKPAEANGYPGPKHVLELADALALSAEQRQQVADVRAGMLQRARRVGTAIVEHERALDAAFRSRSTDPSDVNARVLAIAQLQGELRTVHLTAHLEVAALLTPDQIQRYVALRAAGHGR